MSIFRDKVAFVTGAGSGLGQALSEELGRQGATCIVTDINRDAAASVADRIVAAGGRALVMELDVSKADSVTAAVERAVAEYGRLDYMFNNAGIIILAEVRDMNLQQWNRIIGVNLMGVLHGTIAAYSQMVRQGSGHIVNIASVGGLVQMPTYAAYAATKHAVVGLTTSLRAEADKLGVKVTVVCPGPIQTGIENHATIINASREILESRARDANHKVHPAKAVSEILRGVERNRAIVVFPRSARLLWWIHRIQPAFLAPLDSYFVKTLRAARTNS